MTGTMFARPLSGVMDGIEREDDADGFKGGPEARLGAHLVRLVVGADRRCICGRTAEQCRCKDPYPQGRAVAGRPDRQTFQDTPGYGRQTVLGLHRPVMADDACPLCGKWSCDPSKCPPASAAPAPVLATASAPRTGPGVTAPALGQGPAPGVSA
ncbi:hypothetical protein [Streptomyces antimycoticus]|uniref:hypothetical protein n=1 Tax=Streptomyces antimycoticus TaxID=68175 RepID=UPI0036EAB954